MSCGRNGQNPEGNGGWVRDFGEIRKFRFRYGPLLGGLGRSAGERNGGRGAVSVGSRARLEAGRGRLGGTRRSIRAAFGDGAIFPRRGENALKYLKKCVLFKFCVVFR